MALRFVQQISTGIGGLDTSISDIMVRANGSDWNLFVTSGFSGGLTSWTTQGSTSARQLDSVTFPTIASFYSLNALSLVAMNGTFGIIGFGSSRQQPIIYSVDDTGMLGDGGTTGPLPADVGRLRSILDLGNGRYLIADSSGGELHVLRLDRLGFTSTQRLFDTNETHLASVKSLTRLTVDGKNYAIAADEGEKGITLLDLSGPEVTAVSSFGAMNGLGMMVPTAVEAFTIGGRSFVVVGSAQSGSGALSVLEIQNGALVPVDHHLDTLHSRFGQVQAVAHAQLNGCNYLVAGGGDDGLSLFAVLPNGVLVHLQSIADSLQTGLQDVSALEMVAIGNSLRIFVAGQDEPGLSVFEYTPRFRADTAAMTSATSNHTASPEGAWVIGEGGHDTLTGGAGADLIYDGRGNDVMTGGAGADRFVLAQDNQADTITDFTPGEDLLDLSAWLFLYDPTRLTVASNAGGAVVTWRGESLTLLRAGGGSISAAEVVAAVTASPQRMFSLAVRNMVGTDGNDVITGSWTADHIDGKAGDDTLRGEAGDDTLIGGAGADLLYGGTGADVLDGGAGNNTLEGGAGNDVLIGGLGASLLRGGDGADRLTGGAENDTLYGGDGDDILIAGLGNDVVHDSGGSNHIDLGGGNDVYVGKGVGTDRVRIIGGLGNDTITSGAGNDVITGGLGADVIRMGGGNDLFEDDKQGGAAGTDRVWGGAGHDTLRTAAGADRLYGDSGNDRLIGSAESNWLYGGSDHDVILGYGGADFLYGDSGNDTIIGGTGRDKVWLGSGNDVFLDDNEGGAAGIDTVWGGPGNDRLRGLGGNDILFGDQGNDTLWGGAGDDLLLGGDGADRMTGESGNDRIAGGKGRDVIWMGSGNDVFIDMIETGYAGSDVVDGGDGNDTLMGRGGMDTLIGGAGNDRIWGGTNNDKMSGGSGMDQLFGNQNEDRLWGGVGNDTLVGGGGRDTMSGGPGSDTFIFDRGDSLDHITDFNVSADRLMLRGISHSTVAIKTVPDGTFVSWDGGAVVLDGLFGVSLSDLNIV